MLTYNLQCLKKSLIDAGKISLEEYDIIYPQVKALENDTSIEVFSYALGQICVTF